MLTKGDDYPIHQTPEPVAYAGTDRNFYDRYFFNGYSRDGETFFAAALGVYPHLNVMDAAFCVIHDGRQHNVRASRVLHMERLDTRVGPIEVEVIEPLEVLRICCADEENGVKADIRFSGRVGPVQEPRFTRRVGSQTMMDLTRMTQNGSYEGAIEVGGERIALTPETFWGTRDRSWGIRPVGLRDPQVNPYATEPQFYWLWAPCNFPGCATFYHVNTDAEGAAWNTNGVIAPLTGEAAVMASVESRIDFASGTRHAAAAEVRLTGGDGAVTELGFVPRYTFFMKGLGYGDPEWSHGTYHGELDTAYDCYRLADMNPAEPRNLHIQAICDVTLRRDGAEEKGVGTLEQLILGRHRPSGFNELLDLAP